MLAFNLRLTALRFRSVCGCAWPVDCERIRFSGLYRILGMLRCFPMEPGLWRGAFATRESGDFSRCLSAARRDARAFPCGLSLGIDR